MAQVTQITGTTKWETSVYLVRGSNVVEKLLAGETVIIVDADDTYFNTSKKSFFTIQYKQGNAYVSRTSIECKSSELKELMKTRKKTPIVMKKPILAEDYMLIHKISHAQNNTNINQLNQNLKLKTNIDTLQYQISFTNYCLQKHRNEMLLGRWLEIGGAVGISFFNISQLNGMRAAQNNYNHELALAGTNHAKQTAATNKFETKSNEIVKRQDIATIVGGVAILAGAVLQLNSYKWLKRAYITPSENGIGVKIIF